jgi:hypothetical protein
MRVPVRSLLEAYFAGERWSALYTGCVNLLFVVIGIALVLRGNDFQRGAAWALIGLGALHVVAAVGYALDLHRRVPRYEALLARDPAEFKRAELTRMEGVVSGFTPIGFFYGGLLLTGAAVATYGFARRGATWPGIGLSVCLQGLAALALETIDYRRALRYEHQVGQFDLGAARKHDKERSPAVSR